MPKLTAAQIKSSLSQLPDWKKKGSAIVRTYKFDDFKQALKFVNTVGRLAEKVNHHPDIDIRYNKVTLSLVTHDAGALTENDFALAKKIDAV